MHFWSARLTAHRGRRIIVCPGHRVRALLVRRCVGRRSPGPQRVVKPRLNTRSTPGPVIRFGFGSPLEPPEVSLLHPRNRCGQEGLRHQPDRPGADGLELILPARDALAGRSTHRLHGLTKVGRHLSPGFTRSGSHESSPDGRSFRRTPGCRPATTGTSPRSCTGARPVRRGTGPEGTSPP